MLKSNEYFDGKVKSISVATSEGPATVGVMEAGAYEFGTSSHEIMTVITGALDIKLPGADSFKTFVKGETFEVEANNKFQVVAKEETSYICYYK